MSKKLKIIVNTGNADNNQSVEVTQGQGGRGQPVLLQAKAGAKYQLLDLEKAQAVGPDYVKVKRVGKNLHILFEGSTEADVIIEDYYDVMPEAYNGVVGQAENGNFYEYIPEDPDVKGLIPQLADGGQEVSVALGGAEVVGSGSAIALLAFNPLLAGLGLLGAGAAAAAAGAGGGGTTTVAGQKTALAFDPISADNTITVTEGNAPNVLVTGRVTGVFKEGDVVELVVNNKTYAAGVMADGTFSVSVPMADLKADADTKIDGSINGTGGDHGTASQDYQVLSQGGPTTTALAIDSVTSDNVIGAAENTGNIAVTGKVSGLFSAGDVVTLIVNGKTFTGATAANGGFSINVPASDLVADADTKLEGRVTGTGGTAADAFQDYALADNITPITSKTALRLNAVTADNVISASENTGSIAISGTVSGTFAAGDVVTLTVNGKNFTGAAAANGTFSINVPAAELVADSDTMIEARVTGTGGDTVNAVQDYSTNLDANNSDKTALAIDPISGDNIITVTEGNASSLLVTGRVTGVFKEGDVVSLVSNNKTYGATVNADGTFSVHVSMADLKADIDTQIEASIAATGGSIAKAAQDYQVLTQGGPAVTALAIDLVTADNIIAASENVGTIAVTGRVIGAFSAGDIVTLLVNGKNFTGTAAATGAFTINVPAADLVADSGTAIEGRVSGTGGTTANAIQDYALDSNINPAPQDNKTALAINPITGDNIINAAESGAANTAINGTVTGKFATGDVVTLTVNSKTFTGTAATNGTFSINVPTSDLIADSDTAVEGRVTGTGGTVATASQDYAVDTTVPTAIVTLDKLTPDNLISAAEAGQTSLPVIGAVTGDVKPGDVVTVPVNGKPFTTTIQANGSFSVNIPTSDLLADPDTKYEVTVALGDAAGNTGTATASNNYDSIVTPPPSNDKTALAIDPISSDNIISVTEGNASSLNVTGKVTGAFSAGDVITLTLNNQTITTTAGTDGSFSVAVSMAELKADADTKIEGSVTGTGGSAASSSQDYQVPTADTTAPTTTVDITAISVDSGVSTSDFITNDNNGLTVSATLSAALASGEKLFYSKDNGTTWTDITTSVTGTAVSHVDNTLTSTSTIRMQVRDAASNAGAADSQLITIDTVAPAPVVSPEDPGNPPAGKASLTIDAITTDNVVNTAEGAQASVPITGTARGEFTTGDVVTLTVNAKTFTGSVAANGTFSINVPGADLLADADKTIAASVAATDVAGNVGTVSANQVYTADTTAPTTTVDITAISVDSGVSTSDFITNDNNGLTVSATLSAALASGEKLFYSKDNGTTWTDITTSVTGTAVSHVDNTLTSTSTIRMQVLDAASNAGAADSQLVTIDTSVPTNADVGLSVTISSDTNNDGTVSAAELNSATTFTTRVSVNSNAKVGDTVVINATNGSTAQTAITRVLTSTDISNGFDVTFNTPAVDATQTVTANFVDAAGNAATDTQATDNAILGPSNTAPVANPTTVTNAFAASTGPEVTITDSVSAATVANSTDVTFTLTFNEAIKPSTLTEADLSVTNGTLKAGTLTQVNATTWTVQATSAATGINSMALTVAEGSYTNAAGVVGDGGSGVQAYGTVTSIGGPEINGTPGLGVAPTGWTIAIGSPDIFNPTATSTPSAGYAQKGIEGTSLNGNNVAALGTVTINGGLHVEGIKTTLSSLVAGNTYTYGVQWQQIDIHNGNSAGGQLKITVGGTSTVFTSPGVNDGWQTALVKFVATSTSMDVELAINGAAGISGTSPYQEGFIVVDSLTAAQIQTLSPLGKVLTGTTAADTLLGADEADTITAAGGADTIFAGAGDDSVTINESNVTALSGATAMVIDGGTGVNTLTLANTSAAATIDLTNATVADRLKNFSSIDLTGTQNNTLKLDWRAISTLSGATDNTATGTDESKMLVVSGNAGDAVNLISLSSWNAGTSQTAASLTSTYGSSYNFLSGHTYKAYTLNGATVFVDDAITLTNLASSTTAFTPVTNAMTVQALFGPSFTDANAGQTFTGVAITSAGTTANVTAGLKYEYSTDGGTTWTHLAGGLTDSTAVFLAPTALIRFVDTSGAATAVPSTTLTARLVDSSGLTGTSGLTSGTTVDAHINGGSTAFSGSPVTVSLLNRAPVSSDADGIVVAALSGATGISSAGVTAPGSYVFGDTTMTITGPDMSNLMSTSRSETNTVTFSMPVNQVQIDVSFLSELSGSSGTTVERLKIFINGQAYDLSQATFSSGGTLFGKYPTITLANNLTFNNNELIGTFGDYDGRGLITITVPSGINSVRFDSSLIGTLNGFGVAIKGLRTASVPLTPTVEAIFGQYFTDADNNAFAGVMVSGAGTSAQQSSLGKYQYSKDGGTNWVDLASSTSDTSAVYLEKSNLVRFVPTGSNSSADKFDLSVRLVDSSAANTFTAGNVVNVSGANNGGSTAVSGDTITLRSSVQPNNAPVLTDSTLALAPVAEGSTATPTGAVGTLVSSLTGNITDPDGPLVSEGIAITGVDTTKGTLFISLNGGTTWTQVTQTLSNTNALLLSADADNRVYFRPATGVTGTVSSALTIRGWDKTSGSEGSLADTSTNGGNSAFSTATDTVSLELTTASVTNSSNGNVAPVVLDLNRDGQIDYSRVLMDANSDGAMDSVLWAGQHDGVLVWDKYRDGQVHNHSQYAFTLYGGNTDLEGLAAGFDTNQDGVFSLKDEQFLAFKVWQDKDQDGVVDSGEMRSLNDWGIASIDLVSDGVKRTPVDGVEEAGRSSATTTDGQSIMVVDASFEFTTADPQAMAPGVYSMSLGQSLDLSQLMDAGHAQPTALAQIDMATDTSANVLSLSLIDVLNLPATEGVHQLKVTGAANDKLMLVEGEWTDTGAVVDQGGHRYALYSGTSDSTTQLLIDQHMLQNLMSS